MLQNRLPWNAAVLYQGPLWLARETFNVGSLVVLLAILAAIPVVQLIAFGYLLNVAGSLAAGSSVRAALPQLRQAGQIGLAMLALSLAALLTRLLTHWEAVATLIDPASDRAAWLRVIAINSSLIALAYLLWAWVRGGQLFHYVWPEPRRLIREGWRWSRWREVPDRLWQFTASLRLKYYFWLGLRAMLGTLLWLIPAFVVVAAFREGETGWAGLVGALAVVALGSVLLYLPMLQAHFAAENRFRALFEVSRIRADFRRAPWAWFGAMVVTLILTPIPLYLLKIEATPREVMWLPCLVFVAFILPARLATGLALRRARRLTESTSWWGRVSRGAVRLMMPLVIATYLTFVYISQYTSWDGLATWVQQHAVLIPVPFFDGV